MLIYCEADWRRKGEAQGDSVVHSLFSCSCPVPRLERRCLYIEAKMLTCQLNLPIFLKGKSKYNLMLMKHTL